MLRGLVFAMFSLVLSTGQVLAQGTPSPENAKVYFIWPGDGQVIRGGKFWLRFGLRNMGVAPSGADENDFIEGDGLDNFMRLNLRYLLPIGEGRDEIISTFRIDRGLLVEPRPPKSNWSRSRKQNRNGFLAHASFVHRHDNSASSSFAPFSLL